MLGRGRTAAGLPRRLGAPGLRGRAGTPRRSPRTPLAAARPTARCSRQAAPTARGDERPGAASCWPPSRSSTRSTWRASGTILAEVEPTARHAGARSTRRSAAPTASRGRHASPACRAPRRGPSPGDAVRAGPRGTLTPGPPVVPGVRRGAGRHRGLAASRRKERPPPTPPASAGDRQGCSASRRGTDGRCPRSAVRRRDRRHPSAPHIPSETVAAQRRAISTGCCARPASS